jgi:TolA-binding protein
MRHHLLITRMPRLTITVPEDMDGYLKNLVEDDDQPVIDSKSGAVRACIEMHRDGEVSDEDAVREYEARIQELESQLQAANRRIDDANDVIETSREMVRVRERETSLQERRASAGAFTRFKWWLVGDTEANQS